MCGWPAGMQYPATEGELDQIPAPEAVDSTEPAAEEPDHVAAQLDALAGMMARQDQAHNPEAASIQAQADPAAEEPKQADSGNDAPTAEDSSEPEQPQQEIDPLTAPLSALTGSAAVAAPEAVVAPTADSSEQVDSSEPVESAEPISLPEAVLEPAGEAPGEFPPSPPADAKAPREPGTTATILRPAQLLIVATAALNLILVGLNAVLGTTSGSITTVVLGVALLDLAVWTGAAVMFLHWVSRAHDHVAATAASRQRHGSSMSLIGWFIPIAGFVIGYRVLQDLWTGSDPATRDRTDAPPAKVRTIDIWLLGIVTAALFGYAMPVALGTSALWGGLSAMGLMVAALSLASTMGTITAWQVQQGDARSDDEAGVVTESFADTGVEPATAEAIEADASGDSVSAPEPVSISAE